MSKLAEIREHNGCPSIFINGEPTTSPVAFIRTRELVNNVQTLFFDKEYFKKLGESGIKIYFISCNTFWLQQNALEMFDREARQLLEAIPDAYIIARFGLHPPNKWLEENPDECVLYSDGTSPSVDMFTESYRTTMPRMYSLCSDKWRKDAGDALVKTWVEVMKLPYADRIIACFPAAGHASEWVYRMPGVTDSAFLGCCKPFRKEFSLYLKEKYGTDENLQKAWKDKTATISNPKLPTLDMLHYIFNVDTDGRGPRVKLRAADPVPPAYNNGTHIGSFCDMDKCPQVVDFYHAWACGIARSQIYFAKRIKEITPDRLVGMCYGSQNSTKNFNEGRAAGTRMILESPYIDFLENPSVYENRRPGGSTAQRVCTDSFSLYNKVYLCQDDTRTLAENHYNQYQYRVWDMIDTIDVMKREFGKCICEDMPQWWFDQLIGGKRFKYPEIYSLFGKQQQIIQKAMSLDRTKKSDIAFIFDEESIVGVSFDTNQSIIENLRVYQYTHVGASIDQYYHNDMANPNMPSYKLYVFVNTFILTDKEREIIKAKLKRDKAVALFVYGSGFANPSADKKMSAKHISDLTGINIETDNECYKPMFRWNGQPHPISDGLDRRKPYGVSDNVRLMGSYLNYKDFNTYLYPMFYADDDDAVTVASFLSNGKPAVSVKQCDGYTSVFYGGKELDFNMLRSIAKFAGAHIFCNSSDVTYIGRNFITFHASSEGKKTLYFPRPVTVTEVYEDKCYGKNVTKIDFDAYFGQTKMFYFTEE